MESSKVPQEDINVTESKSSTFSADTPGAMVPKSEPISMSQIQEWIEPVVDFLAKLPDDIGTFFEDYKKPLLTLLLFLSGLVTVYITLAVLDAIRDIPLLSPLFELVGLGYAAWFIYRYMLRESTRQELLNELDSLKKQVVGKTSQNS